MTARVERLAGPVRDFVLGLAPVIDATSAEVTHVQAPRVSSLGYDPVTAASPLRVAWWLAAQWLTAVALEAVDPSATLAETEAWFYGPAASKLPALAPAVGGPVLPAGMGPPEIRALLPYVLDSMSPGTRRHVLRSESHLGDRSSRKKRGVYYTPADVADYMVMRAAPDGPKWTAFDPACGTAVFLRAALAASAADVFGCDIDPFAADMAAFVLVAASVGSEAPSPWAAWHLARLKVAVQDALLLQSGTELDDVQQRSRRRAVESVRLDLTDGAVPEAAPVGPAYRSLGALFPALLEGADVLLSNPPYAKLGDHPALTQLGHVYATYDEKPPTPAANVFPMFVEMGWRLSKERTGSAAFVVPLSLAVNGTAHYRSLRRAIQQRPGSWEFSFFDRTPDALFGDDVKTRNAVAVHHRRDDDSGIAVTGLLRWTSRTRAAFFSTIVPVNVRAQIVEGIPKLGTRAEAALYTRVRGLSGAIGTSLVRAAAVPATAETARQWANTVFVGPTAYNWLSVMRGVEDCVALGHQSESALLAMQFPDASSMSAAYAILSSRLAYWLWRVEGDAFHVTRAFVERLPFALESLDDTTLRRLADVGNELWSTARKRPVVAQNRGRQTVAFPAAPHVSLCDRVDAAVLTAFGLDAASRSFSFREWYRRTVVVDDADTKRSRMLIDSEDLPC
jgi:hypothetical protein